MSHEFPHELIDRLIGREKAMAAEIEPEPVVFDRFRQTADNGIPFIHPHTPSGIRQGISRRKTGEAAAENNNSIRTSVQIVT
jgi:hypothetical protein